MMASIDESSLYEDLVDVLTEGVDRTRLAAFRLPESKQNRLDELLEKNREGTLSPHDEAELATFSQLEHVVRLLKARLLQRNTP
jgi:hypothetical protein